MLDKFDVDWVSTLNPEYKKPIKEWTLKQKFDFIGILCHWRTETCYTKGENEAAKTFCFISDMVKDLDRNRVVETEKTRIYQEFMDKHV